MNAGLHCLLCLQTLHDIGSRCKCEWGGGGGGGGGGLPTGLYVHTDRVYT